MSGRRQFLRSAALGAGILCFAPRLLLAGAKTERRFVFIIQRGAADGLDTVIPYADPGLAKLRAPLLNDPAKCHNLDGLFALHPALGRVADLYRDKQALLIQAVASPYRDRSHFDGQNVLESGGTHPYAQRDGWLNRLTALLPQARREAIALAASIPLALRGPAPVTSYAPSSMPQASDDLLLRVARLYQDDPQLHGLWSKAMATRELAGEAHAKQDSAGLGKLAAEFLRRPDGPRIAMLETTGWDTHGNQKTRLGQQLAKLDKLLGALKDGLGPVWSETCVLVATEFGRTAAVNGTGGTDHGTASAAMLLGGAVKGGRVLADWPGLAKANLYQGRDLKPTLDLDHLIAAAAAQSLRLDVERTQRALFPGRRFDTGLEGLVRS